MKQCQCIISRGQNAKQRCPHPAKYPKSKPTHCGYHKLCRKEAGIEEGLVKCDQLSGMMNLKSSCYMDSLLYAIFHKPNEYINKYILNTYVPQLRFGNVQLNQIPDLFNITVTIQNELKKIRHDMHNGELFYCTQLRHHLSEHQKLYLKYGGHPEIMNWLSEQNEPLDVLSRLLHIFQPPEQNVTQITSYGTNTQNPSRSEMEMVTDENRKTSISRTIDVDSLYDLSVDPDDITNIEIVPKDSVNLDELINRHNIIDLGPENAFLAPSGKKYNIRVEDTKYRSAPLLHVHISRIAMIDEKVKIETSIVPNQKLHLLDGSVLDLSSIIVHDGGVHGGHYRTFFKCDRIWYEYNDIHPPNLVKKIGSFQQVIEYDISVLNTSTDYFYIP